MTAPDHMSKPLRTRLHHQGHPHRKAGDADRRFFFPMFPMHLEPGKRPLAFHYDMMCQRRSLSVLRAHEVR